MDLYGKWNDPSDRDAIWEAKKPKYEAINYTTSSGDKVTVQKGYWFSSHEQWK